MPRLTIVTFFFLSTETACSEGVYDTPYGNFSFARI